MIPIPHKLEALEKAIEKLLAQEFTLRQAAEFIEQETGEPIAHNTIRNKLTPVQRAKITKKGYQTPPERVKAANKRATRRRAKTKQAAKKMKQDIRDVKSKILEEKKSKVGRVLTEDQIQEMDSSVQEVVHDNVLFKPNPGPQEEFLAAPETDVLFGGAAGGGKSYAFLIDPLRFAHKRAHRALLLRKSMPELRELIDKSRELYPQAFPGAKFKEVEKTWLFPSGAKLEFGFLEKDADVYRYQGQAYSWIGFDEITHLTTEFPWQYLGSRLRTIDPEITCYMRATTNPGGPGHSWVKKRYIDPAPENQSFRGKDGITRKFIPAKLTDNPYLYADGRYEQMLKGLDEVSRRRLLDGDWNINEGIAFSEFSRARHVIDPFDIPSHWYRFKGVDYGYAAPSAVVWCAVDPEDKTIIVYRELYAKGLTGEMLADRMLDLEMLDPSTVSGVLDTAAWNKTGYTGPTIGETLNRAGLKLRPADKNRLAGKIQVHERLRPNMNSGRPGLQFFSSCKNLIREIESLPTDPNNSEDVDTKAEDHAYDALRYALMSRPKNSTFDRLAHLRLEQAYRPVDPIFGA